MSYLILFHWGWLLAAALLGFGMGWICVVQRGKGMSQAAVQQAVLLGCAFAALAAVQAIPGRLGYWFDLGLGLLIVYSLGCMIGATLRSWVVARHFEGG